MKNIAIAISLLASVAGMMGMDSDNQVHCSEVKVWRGENDTQYNKGMLSLYLGTYGTGKSFVQVSDDIVDSFPKLRSAVINNRPFVEISSFSDKNIILMQKYLNAQGAVYYSFIRDVSENDLEILNSLMTELGGARLEKMPEYTEGKYLLDDHDVKKFSLIADTCRQGNCFIQITKDVQATVPGLKDSNETEKSIKGIGGQDEEELLFLAKYMIHLKNKSFNMLTDLIDNTRARTIQKTLPVLKDLYKTNNPIGFDGSNDFHVVECSNVMQWQGNTNTLYDRNLFSLYLGEYGIGKEFVQVSDRVVNSFPVLRSAVISNKQFLGVSSLSKANINLIQNFLNQTPVTHYSFIQSLSDQNLHILNTFVTELGASRIEKEPEYTQGKYLVNAYDSKKFSLIADTCAHGNCFIQISKDVQATVPGLKDSKETGKSFKGINGQDLKALLFLAKYMTLLKDNDLNKLTNLMSGANARTLATVLPVLKDLYKTNNPIGFDSNDARISWARAMYTKFGQPVLQFTGVLAILYIMLLQLRIRSIVG